MTWHPADLVSDVDLDAYEGATLSRFTVTDWHDRIDRALEDWLFPALEGAGFPPHRIKTRVEPTKVYGYTGAVYTDLTSDAIDSGSTLDVAFATVFATPASDALYIGSDAPFRGVAIGLLDSVSAVAAALKVFVWTGAWQEVGIADGTSASGVTLARGGSVTWTPPSAWSVRPVNSQSAYWVKVTTSATPTAGTSASTLAVIRASRLRGPATLRTLALIFREAPSALDGPWRDKAEWYEKEAEAALTRVLPLIGGEFDTDESEAISPDEAAQTATEVSGNAGFRLERA